MNLRIKPRTRLRRDKPDALTVPNAPNMVWSMDFMADRLEDGRQFRLPNVLNDFNREGPGIEVNVSLPAERVIRSLNQIIEWRGKPFAVRVDNGHEYVSGKLMEWAETQGIALSHIQPDKPAEGGPAPRPAACARMVRGRRSRLSGAVAKVGGRTGTSTAWIVDHTLSRFHNGILLS